MNMTIQDRFSRDERDRLEQRMWNWARWALTESGPAKGHCGSAERHYLPSREDEAAFVRSAREQVNVIDAYRIEDAITRLKHGGRQYLLAWYVYRTHPIAMARRFKLGEWALIPKLWIILGALKYQLDHTVAKTARKPHAAAYNLLHPSLEA